SMVNGMCFITDLREDLGLHASRWWPRSTLNGMKNQWQKEVLFRSGPLTHMHRMVFGQQKTAREKNIKVLKLLQKASIFMVSIPINIILQVMPLIFPLIASNKIPGI